MPKTSFEDQYPNIARWVYNHEGWIEIGNDPDSPLTSFVRAIDLGGIMWEGAEAYDSLDEALADLDAGVQACLEEIYGEEAEA